MSHFPYPTTVDLGQKIDNAVEDLSSHFSVHKPSVVVHEYLSHEQRQLLVSSFPEIKLNFSNSVNHSHPYPAASRRCELYVLLDKIRALSVPSGFVDYDDYVCDIGGDFSTHLLAGREWVHSCCPSLDVRDRQRYVTRVERLSRRITGASATDHVLSRDVIDRVNGFLAGEVDIVDKFYCNNKAECCDRTARYGIALHSSYDISLSQMSEIMIRKNMVECYGTFLYQDKILLETSGFIEGVDCFFSLDVAKDTIEFSFENDPSTIYRHSLKNYMALLTVNYFYSRDNKFVFFVELLENRSGVQFFKITKLPFVLMEHNVMTRFLWLPSMKGKTKINFFDIDYERLAVGDFSKAFVPVSFFVETSLVDKVMSHAYASTEAKFRPVEIFNFLTAYNGRIFFGSDVCVRHKQIDAYKAMLLANAIYIEVYVKKYDIGKVNQLLLAAVKHDRELSEGSLFGKLFHSKFCPAEILGTGHHNVFRFIRSMLAPLHSLLYWFKKSPFSAHKFLENNVRFLRCDTELTPMRFAYLNPFKKVVDSVQDVSMPDVIIDGANFDMQSLFAKVLGDYVTTGQVVIPIKDIEKISCKIFRSVECLGPPEGFLRRFFNEVSVNGDTRIMDCFSSFCNYYVPPSDLCFDDLSFVSLFKSSTVLLFCDNVDLVNYFLLKGCNIVLCGFEVSKTVFLEQGLLEKIRLVDCDEVDFSVLFSVASAFKFDFVVLDDSLSDYSTLLSNAIGCDLFLRSKFFTKFSSKLSFQNFCYIMSSINYRSASILSEKTSFYRVLPSSFKRLSSNLDSFCMDVLVLENSVLSVVASSVTDFSSMDSLSNNASSISSDSSSSSGDSDVTVIPKLSVPSSLDNSASFVPAAECAATKSADISMLCNKVVVGVSPTDSGSVSLHGSFGVPEVASSSLKSVAVVDASGKDDLSVSVSVVDAAAAFVTSTSLSVNSPELCLVSSNDNYSIYSGVDFLFSDLLKNFCASLKHSDAKIRNGKMGRRLEWLFSPHEYRYGSVTTVPISESIPSILLSLPYVREFNTLLVVYYPTSTVGLSYHKDDEPIMDGDRVCTYSVGADCELNIKSTVDGNVSSHVVTSDNCYILKDQTTILHGVRTCGERYALTFRNFSNKIESSVVLDSFNSAALLSDTSISEQVVVNSGKSLVGSLLSIPSLLSSSVSTVVPGLSKPVSPVDYGTVIPNRGGGKCLFYALSGSDTIAADKLRFFILKNRPVGLSNLLYSAIDVDEECGDDTTWAGVATIVAFCHLFYSNVTVVDLKGEIVSACCEFTEPFYDIYLLYNGGHYERFSRLCVSDIVSDSLPFSLNPIDVGYVLQVINKSLLPIYKVKSSGVVGSLVSVLSGTEEFVSYSSVPTSFVFFNPLKSFCFSKGCVCLDGISECLKKCIESKVCSELCLLLPFNYPKLRELEECLVKCNSYFKLAVIPGLAKLGFFLLIVSFNTVQNVRFSLYSAVDLIRTHSLTCTDCAGSLVVSNPYYNYVTRTYYFCSSNNSTSNVIYVSEFEGVEKIFQLRIVGKTTPEEHKSLVMCDNVVYLPVRVKTAGVLSDNRANLNSIKRMLSEFFLSNGNCSCIGILNCGIHDFGPLLSFFSPYVSTVLVKSDRVSSLDTGVDFNPNYVPSGSDTAYIYNALSEAREYYRATVSSIVNNIKPVHTQYLKLLSDRSNRELISETTNNKPDFGLIDMSRGEFVIQPKEEFGPYSYAFNGSRLLDISSAFKTGVKGEVASKIKRIDEWLKPGVYNGLFSVSKDTKLVNGEKIFSRLKQYDLSKINLNCEITLVEGVPGCGKTHYIIKNHKFSLSDTDEIVLTASREAAEDLRRRVAKEFKCSVTNPMLRRRYRTVDSFLMHFDERSTSVNTIWLDEGLMKHFGDILWCAVLSSCKRLIIIGDKAQIPFVNRLGGVVLSYNKINLTASRVKRIFLGVTHRCPVDVAVFLNSLGVYSEPVKSSSLVRRSLRAKHIGNVSEVLNSRYDGYQILTFTQGEKYDIAKVSGRKVFTVNEFQGNQAANVLLVRTNCKDIEIFKSISHILVGVSRHTENFLYATVSMDLCFDYCNMQISDADLEDCTYRRMSGGALLYNVNRSRMLGGGLIMGKTSTKQHALSRVVPRAATMVDMLKQDSRIRDFVQNNLGCGVVPLRVDHVPIECPLPDIPYSNCYYVSDCLVTMQFFYNSIFPGHSLVDSSYDCELFLQDELYFPTMEMLRLTEYCVSRKGVFDSLSPCLRTSCPTPVSSDVKHVLKAFYDRNGNVPELRGIVDDAATVDRMYDVFVSSCVGNMELFNSFSDNPISVNVDSIEDWLFTQPSSVSDIAFNQEFWSIFNRELNVYSLILKKLPKPKLDITAMSKYPSPQTIAHLTKDVNAVFCPIFRELKKRLFSVLRDNVIVFSDMSVEDFESILTVRLPPCRMDAMKYLLEVDMSKYDKSQGRVALLFELKFLRSMGFPEEFLSTWAYMHVYSRVVDRINKVAARVLFQRKSGDAWTFGGNTVHLMAVLLYSLSLSDSQFIDDVRDGECFLLFSGDDSLIFSKRDISTLDISASLANSFNLESKLLKYSTPYFCSKFLILTPWGRWIVVPDVVKLLIKLGRHDLTNFAHVEEYRISCLDVGKHLGNSVLYPLIDSCMSDRYKCDISNFGALYSAMYLSFSDSTRFSKLYFVKDCASISQKVFRKLFDF